MEVELECRAPTSAPLWWLTKDGDHDCLALYERHYSAYRYRDGRVRKLFAGPGEKVVLRTKDGDAMFVWRKFIDASGEQGINCAVFRNESRHQSSELVRQADSIADCLWPDCRHYTYVRAEAVASKNPGFCFIAAGWQRLERRTGSGLRILERMPKCQESISAPNRPVAGTSMHGRSRTPTCTTGSGMTHRGRSGASVAESGTASSTGG